MFDNPKRSETTERLEARLRRIVAFLNRKVGVATFTEFSDSKIVGYAAGTDPSERVLIIAPDSNVSVSIEAAAEMIKNASDSAELEPFWRLYVRVDRFGRTVIKIIHVRDSSKDRRIDSHDYLAVKRWSWLGPRWTIEIRPEKPKLNR